MIGNDRENYFVLEILSDYISMDIEGNIQRIYSKLPKQTKLVAVSKKKPNTDILTAYEFGQRIFGENQVQELKRKYEELPKDIEWHFIGHLQSNKVKYIAPFVALIHAVDSLKLLKMINKQAIKHNRKIDFLFQLHIAKEDSKFGLSNQQLIELLNSEEYKGLTNVNCRGLMGMATNTKDQEAVKEEFAQLKRIFDDLKEDCFSQKDDFNELSMGMSSDYQIAVKYGSTLVRVGSTIFGARQKNKD